MSDLDQRTPPVSTRRIATAVTIGTVVEWYDFFLYGTAAALIFPTVFFPAGDPTSGSLLSFATFATGFAARPVGGLLFGHLGDRIGRRSVLVVTLVLMGLATAGVGLLPSYAAVGVAAPVALVLLRIVQGLGTGGEWGGAALMTKENGARRPGFVGGFLSSAVFAGLILGSLAFTGLSGLLTDEQLLGWGWRIPFLVSVALVGIGLWIRRGLPETAEFREVSDRGARERAPIVAALRRPRNVVAIFLMRLGQNTTFNIVSVFVLTYATTSLGLPKASVLTATVVGAALACVLCPLYGLLGDRIGFRTVMLAALTFQALFAFPFFWLTESRDLALVVVAVTVGIAGGAAAADAIQPAYFTGLFGTQSRFSAVSIGREGGTVVGGGLAPLIAALLLVWQDGSPWAIAAWMVVTSLVGVAGVLLVRPVRDQEPATAGVR
ncbi:MFS transporter [Actinomycetospora sp. NBRC 106375]|uniref:MFS transporter n=1 Tax=Actinomycetospora sp. NBRC 106375 TaxID=3032207 RepID=UPI0024A51C0E|nr:MFS transporter [Actinomycetospora sp. NBRC 106375]GLZ48839.1 MFS transporter [Actinomycetospora sp. NBRC 106375]